MSDDVKRIVEFGLTLDYVTLVLYSAFEKNKADTIELFGKAISHFRSTLNEEELRQFDEDFRGYADKKLQQFLSEASGQLTEEEMKGLLEDLMKGFEG